MTAQNVNVDYCGIVNMLRNLVKTGLVTEKEARKIAARIATKNHVDIVLFSTLCFSLSCFQNHDLQIRAFYAGKEQPHEHSEKHRLQ